MKRSAILFVLLLAPTCAYAQTAADDCSWEFAGKPRRAVKLRTAADGANYTNHNGGKPTSVSEWFAYTCTLSGGAQSYTAKATGSVSMNGYIFQVDERGIRTTQAFPDAVVPANCWMVERNKCQ